MSTRSLSIPAVILTACILGIAALLAGLYVGLSSNRDQYKAEFSLIAGTLYPADFRTLTEFELSDQQGQTFTTEQLAGSWSLIFFGYTYCPDVCPLTLTIFKEIKAKLIGPPPNHTPIENINFILVSVDPERDTPNRLKDYIDFFDPEFIGLTDVSEHQTQLTSLTQSLGAFYGKQDTGAREAYLVDHSAGIFLINPEARVHALFSAPHRATDITQDLLTIIDNYRT